MEKRGNQQDYEEYEDDGYDGASGIGDITASFTSLSVN